MVRAQLLQEGFGPVVVHVRVCMCVCRRIACVCVLDTYYKRPLHRRSCCSSVLQGGVLHAWVCAGVLSHITDSCAGVLHTTSGL
jgi:hypothetical protein